MPILDQMVLEQKEQVRSSFILELDWQQIEAFYQVQSGV